MKYQLTGKSYSPRVLHNVRGWNAICLAFDKNEGKPVEFDALVAAVPHNHPTSTREAHVKWHIRCKRLAKAGN